MGLAKERASAGLKWGAGAFFVVAAVLLAGVLLSEMVPLIVRGGSRIPDKSRGQIRAQFCPAVALMPTILQAAAIDPKRLSDAVPQQHVDGESILPIFEDANMPAPRKSQYFEMLGSRAIYHDRWKATTDHVPTALPAQRELVEGSHDFDTDRWSLFNLDDDFSEAHDLSGTHADTLGRLVEIWWSEAGRNQVLPLNDGYSGRAQVERPATGRLQRVGPVEVVVAGGPEQGHVAAELGLDGVLRIDPHRLAARQRQAVPLPYPDLQIALRLQPPMDLRQHLQGLHRATVSRRKVSRWGPRGDVRVTPARVSHVRRRNS
jgi:hypothetical protein